MGATDPAQIKYVPGRLAINPSDLTAVWPHGTGKGIGVVEAIELDLGISSVDVGPAEEWGDRAVDQIYLENNLRLSVVLREWDDDVLTTIFANTFAGASTSTKGIQGHGAVKPGTLVSARAVRLVFTPDDQVKHPGFLVQRALPQLDAAARLNFAANNEFGFLCLFLGIKGGNGRIWDVGKIADLQSFL